jgi:hypothetical protein
MWSVLATTGRRIGDLGPVEHGGKAASSRRTPELAGYSSDCQWRENLRRGLGGIKMSQLAGAPKPGGTGGGVGGAGAGSELLVVGSVQGDAGAGCGEDARAGAESGEGAEEEHPGELG